MTDKWLKKFKKDSVVQKAYKFAKEAHEGTKRKSGMPYIEHPLSVAKTIDKWEFDNATTAAALLHDVVEDTEHTVDDVEEEFGEEISFLVDGVTKLKRIKYDPDKESSDKKQSENMRKLIVATSQDLRVIFIKLADRLHNIKTLESLDKKRQKRIAAETIDIYATLAYRLGMQKLSGRLEDLAFPYLYPEKYKWVVNQTEEKYEERKKYAKKVKPILRKKLKEEGIKPVKIDARAKRYYSLFQKLQRYDMQFDKIYDLVALRIIVDSIEDCYSALGVIHKNWLPMPGRIKDYIAMPKPNGYRSLHTTVFCVDDKITEIQIRTQKMHEEAEMGAAAHWAYQQARNHKKFKKGKTKWKADEKDIDWVEQLRNWQENFKDPDEFINSLKVDFFKDRIFIVTPEQDVIDLPDGSTPVDFAYRIHTEVGNQCTGAKVNGEIVSLDYKLRSGDVVEILTQKGKKPSKSWLEFVKTSIAKSKIKNALKKKGILFKKKHTEPKIRMNITVENRSQILKDVVNTLSNLNIDIESSDFYKKNKGSFAKIRLICEEIRGRKLENALVKLKKVDGVKKVSYKFDR